MTPNKNIKFTPAAKSAASVGTAANAPAEPAALWCTF